MPIYKTIFFVHFMPFCLFLVIIAFYFLYILCLMNISSNLCLSYPWFFSRFFLICFYPPLYSIYSSVFFPGIYSACFPPPPVSSGTPHPRYIVYFYFVLQNRLFVLCPALSVCCCGAAGWGGWGTGMAGGGGDAAPVCVRGNHWPTPEIMADFSLNNLSNNPSFNFLNTLKKHADEDKNVPDFTFNN